MVRFFEFLIQALAGLIPIPGVGPFLLILAVIALMAALVWAFNWISALARTVAPDSPAARKRAVRDLSNLSRDGFGCLGGCLGGIGLLGLGIGYVFGIIWLLWTVMTVLFGSS
ncbi:MAG: hypothetical protein ACOYOB_20540 [Myxococcota bacterium]